jgi:hypothetical protein
VQEAAFGAEGEPGDPNRIEHIASRIVGIYEELLDWAARIRGTGMSEEFARSLELLAHAADRPITEIREFIDHFVTEAERFPTLLSKGRQLTLHFQLTLTADEALLNEVVSEAQRAFSSLTDEQ